MAFTPLSAKNAKVRVGNYVLTARVWNVKPHGDAEETSNFEGGGFGDFTGCLAYCDFNVDGHWDSASDPFANPPNIVVTAVISTVKLYTNDIGSPFWSFPSALVVDTPMDADVKTVLSISIACKAKGSFVYP
jgi:hypothetical protein